LNLHKFWFITCTQAAKFIISFSQSCHWFHAPKTTLDSEKQRADDTEKKYSEVKEISEERRKKLEETEKKVQQLQESLQR
jgi:ribosomal protein L31